MKNYKIIFFLLITFGFFYSNEVISRDRPVLKLHYYSYNNRIQYLILESGVKKETGFFPQVNKKYELYLDSVKADNLIGTLITNIEGKAKSFIPPTLQQKWESLSTHSFILVENGEELISDYIITKSKINIDTLNEDGVRNIEVSLKKLVNNNWVSAANIEMKVGIKRNTTILSAGDELTYTTDTSGKVKVNLTKLLLPGDTKGNYTIAAKVEENETLGNLYSEEIVPWGTVTKIDTDFFNQRTLWSTRFRTPYWLLFLVYSIVLGVWGTLVYLVVQIYKIKKISKDEIT